jgi:hypothetical protein
LAHSSAFSAQAFTATVTALADLITWHTFVEQICTPHDSVKFSRLPISPSKVTAGCPRAISNLCLSPTANNTTSVCFQQQKHGKLAPHASKDMCGTLGNTPSTTAPLAAKIITAEH